MRILAVETATEACSVALWTGTDVVERFEVAAQGHAQLLMPMLQAVLAEAGVTLPAVDVIAFGQGPGSFTGVRIATAFVQGLAIGLERPALGVSSLKALAQRCMRRTGAVRVAAAFDARMGQVYWGTFESAENGCALATVAEAVVNPGEVARLPDSDWRAAGVGWQVHGALLSGASGILNAGEIELWPHAAEVAWLAAHDRSAGSPVAGEDASPVYLRDRVAEKKR